MKRINGFRRSLEHEIEKRIRTKKFKYRANSPGNTGKEDLYEINDLQRNITQYGDLRQYDQ